MKKRNINLQTLPFESQEKNSGPYISSSDKTRKIYCLEKVTGCLYLQNVIDQIRTNIYVILPYYIR